MRPEPTLEQKIAEITDPRELEGFLDQLFTDGRITPDLQQAIARRRAELQRRR